MTDPMQSPSSMRPGGDALLRLALPSKGRLLDPTLDFLKSCGFAVKGVRGSREYSAHIPSLPECVIDLTSASEIPDRLAKGEVHLAVTGLDLVSEMLGRRPAKLDEAGESRPGDPLLVHMLGYGRADLVVAVPRAWIDVDTMADLAEVAQAYRLRHGRRIRIATKYHTLTRTFFGQNNVVDYRIVRSAGATEAAPATGVADIVVDITSTGETLAANHLKTIRNGTILQSQACLFVSRGPAAVWSEETQAIVRRLLDMVDAKINAASRKLILTRLPGLTPDQRPEDFETGIRELEEELSGIVQSRVEFFQGDLAAGARPSASSLSVMLTVQAPKTHDAVRVLRAHGAQEVIVLDTDYVFDDARSSCEALFEALKAAPSGTAPTI